jgi:hypothetical protein
MFWVLRNESASGAKGLRIYCIGGNFRTGPQHPRERDHHRNLPAFMVHFYLLSLRHSQGGIGSASAHKPRLAAFASSSMSDSVSSSGAYFRYHQHIPAFTNSRDSVFPDSKCTLPITRLYRSFPLDSMCNTLPYASLRTRARASFPPACLISGQSTP